MTPRDRERFKRKLLDLRTEMLREGDIELDPIRRDETDIGGDEDEQPLAEMSQVVASKRNRVRTETLVRVGAALKRLEEQPDEFGLCGECGESIGKRLEALPFVELCVECQQEKDAGPKLGRRRHAGDFR